MCVLIVKGGALALSQLAVSCDQSWRRELWTSDYAEEENGDTCNHSGMKMHKCFPYLFPSMIFFGPPFTVLLHPVFASTCQFLGSLLDSPEAPAVNPSRESNFRPATKVIFMPEGCWSEGIGG